MQGFVRPEKEPSDQYALENNSEQRTGSEGGVANFRGRRVSLLQRNGRCE